MKHSTYSLRPRVIGYLHVSRVANIKKRWFEVGNKTAILRKKTRISGTNHVFCE